MPKTPLGVLVPLDGSQVSEQGLAFAAPLVARNGGRLILLSVPSIYTADLSWADAQYGQSAASTAPILSLEGLVAESERATLVYLDAVAARLRGEGLTVEVRTPSEVPARAILSCAQADDVSLIVMASHGRGGLTRWALGSVADKVVQAAGVPVVLLRGDAPRVRPDLGRIVAALDGSPLSAQVLPTVAWLAKTFDAPVTLVTVAAGPEQVLWSGLGGGSLVDASRPERAAEDYLAGQVEALRRDGIAADSALLVGEDVAETLCNCAAAPDVGLLAITTHGRGGLARWALGSVADRVARTSKSPVLIERVL
ncbi:MAG: universal stress protein [Ardenticatenales bacterium]